MDRLFAAPIAYGLKHTISLSFFGISPAIPLPASRIAASPFLAAQPMIGLKFWIRVHLVTLPGRFSGPAALRLHAVALIFVPETRGKKIIAMNADDLFHIHHLNRSYRVEGKSEDQ